MRRALTVGLVVTAVGLTGCDLLAGGDEPPLSPAGASIDERSPAPGQPPIAWLGGRLQEIAPEHITLLDASDNTVRMQRLTGGATRFLRSDDGGTWRELSEDEAAAVEVGGEVCAEALLDGSNFVALRVFLDASCGPTGAVP